MVIFKPAIGGLPGYESQAKICKDFYDMKNYICDMWERFSWNRVLDPDDIVVEEVFNTDGRFGQRDVWCVYSKKNFDGEVCDCPKCVGMCATDF